MSSDTKLRCCTKPHEATAPDETAERGVVPYKFRDQWGPSNLSPSSKGDRESVEGRVAQAPSNTPKDPASMLT